MIPGCWQQSSSGLALVAYWDGLFANCTDLRESKLVQHHICAVQIRYFTNFCRLVALSLSLLVLPFLPASNLFFRVGFVLAERVLYLPSAGYCLLIALGVTTLASQSTLMRRVSSHKLFCVVSVANSCHLVLQVVSIFVLYLMTVFVWRSVHVSCNQELVPMNVSKHTASCAAIREALSGSLKSRSSNQERRCAPSMPRYAY